MRKTILAVFAFLSFGGVVQGAETEQKYGFNPESFEIKYYIQPRYSWYSESVDTFDESFSNGTDNSFSVRRSRVYLTSTVIPNLKARVQFEVKPDKVEALDVYFDWAMPIGGKQPLIFTLGQFKKPFSYQEFVMSSSNLNLIDRTYTHAVLEKRLFATARDQGVMVKGDFWEYDVPVQAFLGVFNGNGAGKKFDVNSGKQMVARADVTPLTGLTVGGNLEANLRGYSSDSTSTESYTVWGADAVFTKNGFQVLGEVFGGDRSDVLADEGSAGLEVPTFFAWYAEAIYRAKSGWEPAARFEMFDPDTDTEEDARTLVTGQLAYSFSPNFRWQVNVVYESFQDDAMDSLTGVLSQWTLRL